MAKKGLTQANTLRSNNTTASGYGIVYADEIIGGRSVKTRKDLDNLPDWVLGEDDGLDIGTTCYVQDKGCQYTYAGDGWYKSYHFIGLPVNAWDAYTASATEPGVFEARVLDIANFTKSEDLYIDTLDAIPHPFATIVVHAVYHGDDETIRVPVAYITLFESGDSETATVVASAKVFGTITDNTFPRTPNFNNINYYEGSCNRLISTKITNWIPTGGAFVFWHIRANTEFQSVGNIIKTSEIDFNVNTLETFNDSVAIFPRSIRMQYSVVDATHNNIVGQMLLIGDSMGHMVTEILTTSATLKDGIIDWNEHSDTVVNTYIRRNHVKEGGTSSIAVGSWSKWTYYSGEGQYNDFKTLVAKELSKKVDKVTGKQLSTNDFTNTLKTKLDGIAENANNYSLPTASETKLGGVMVDSVLNSTSTNPVQNKAINSTIEEINSKLSWAKID